MKQSPKSPRSRKSGGSPNDRPPRDVASGKSYHHGDLRRALIDATVQLIRQGDVEAVSLRGVARKANVSHSAPYHHFSSKKELLAAVAADGFDRMVATIRELAETFAADGPIGLFRAVGMGYLQFAAKEPSVFRIMFRPELTSPDQQPFLRDAEARAFGTLQSALVACAQQGAIPQDQIAASAAMSWSTVHGLSMLHIDGVLAETPLGEVPFEQLAQLVNETLLRKVTGLIPLV